MNYEKNIHISNQFIFISNTHEDLTDIKFVHPTLNSQDLTNEKLQLKI